jgi:peptidoglycan/xylan/chitin deacetylase (PgdA/CDA1 family)
MIPIRRTIIALLRVTGLLSLFLYLRRGDIIILMVHGVVDEAAATHSAWRPSWARHSTTQLDSVLRVLKDYFTFISIGDATDMISGAKPMVANGLVITFDDGYKNNLKYAYPIIKKYRVPACFYLATGFICSRKPYWIDRLDFALQQLDVSYFDVKMSKFEMRILLGTADEFQKTYREFRLKMKQAYNDDWEFDREIDRLATALESHCGKRLADYMEEDDWSSILSYRDLISMPNDITLGSHTVDHLRAGCVSAEDFEDQLARSHSYIRKLNRSERVHFCYPNGTYTPEAMRQVKGAGYASAVTTVPGVNRAGDNVYSLRRNPFPSITNTNDLLFYIIRKML